jgi:HK97 gp10 family phage protein
VTEATRAVQESGKQLQQAAQAAAPVRTGALRGSIKVTGSGLTATVGTDLRYAPYVEFGTGKMAPEPFLNPAVDGVEGSFYTAVEDAAGKALDV